LARSLTGALGRQTIKEIIMKRAIIIAVISIALFSPALASDFPKRTVSEDRVYTLYRNSITGKEMRYHVATFDADVNEDYNRGNCDIARELFQKQPGVTVNYWCEKGYYKK
jgi:hypothetical protein